MISRFSSFIARKILSGENLTNDERELYNYGFFMLTSHFLYFVLACLFGILFKCFWRAVVFYIVFQLIRRFAGGYHANTESRCEVLTSLSMLGSVGLIRLSELHNFNLPLLCTSLACGEIIFVLSPLDTPEKPLTKKELGCFRKVSRVLSVLILAVIVISYFKELYTLFAPCCIGFALESVLLIAGKIKRQNS